MLHLFERAISLVTGLFIREQSCRRVKLTTLHLMSTLRARGALYYPYVHSVMLKYRNNFTLQTPEETMTKQLNVKIQYTKTFYLFFLWRQIWSLVLRKYTLKVSENKAPKETFQSRNEEVTGGRKKLRNELNNFFYNMHYWRWPNRG
jgi:hypothetical protein